MKYLLPGLAFAMLVLVAVWPRLNPDEDRFRIDIAAVGPAGGAKPHQAYDALVRGEAAYAAGLVARIRAAGGAVVDVAEPLREATRSRLDLYPGGTNGHMAPPGHALVAREVHARVAPLLGPGG